MCSRYTPTSPEYRSEASLEFLYTELEAKEPNHHVPTCGPFLKRQQHSSTMSFR